MDLEEPAPWPTRRGARFPGDKLSSEGYIVYLQFNIIIACASSDESSGINQLSDGLDDEHEEHARLVAYAIRPGPHSDGRDMNLVKLDDWCIDGTAEGVGPHQRADGEATRVKSTAESLMPF